MATENTTAWIRALMGKPESAAATAENAEDSEAEISTEVEVPLTMNDLIRSRPRRHVDLFGRPGETTSPDDEGTEQVPADINAILRAARHRRSTDRAAAEESEE